MPLYDISKPEILTVQMLQKILRSPKRLQVGRFILPAETLAFIKEKLMHHHQRKPSENNVAMLAQAMGLQEFFFTGESCIFLSDGTLGDGQHRILAAIRSGEDIDVLIVFGVPVENFAYLDQGKKRGVVNVFETAGVPHAAEIGPATSWMYRIASGGVAVVHNPVVPPPELLKAYFERFEGLQDFRDEARVLADKDHRHNRALANALCLTFHTADRELAPKFIQQWIKGVSDNRFRPIEDAEQAFSRERARNNGRKVDPRVVCGSMIMAWNAVYTGVGRRGKEPLYVLPRKGAPTIFPQLLPVPEPTDEDKAAE